MGLRTGHPTWLCRPHPRRGMGPISDQAAGVRSRSNFKGFEGKECSLPFLPFFSECHTSSLLEYNPFASRVVVTVQPTVSGIRHMWMYLVSSDCPSHRANCRRLRNMVPIRSLWFFCLRYSSFPMKQKGRHISLWIIL